MNKKPAKRNLEFVDRSVQGGLIRRIALHWVYFFFATAFAYILLQTLLTSSNVPLWTRIQQVLQEFALLGILMFSLLPAFMLDTIRFSNRFVGPIVRLRRYLRDLGQTGNAPALKFRERDFWADMANEFNACRDRILRQQQELEQLRAELNTRNALSTGNATDPA